MGADKNKDAAATRLDSLSNHLQDESAASKASTVARELEEALAAAVEAGKIPHAVVFATNTDGTFTYSHASGLHKYTQDKEPITEDALFMLASQTKLLTAICALKVVEQGLIGLDDDVSPHLAELAARPILTGFDDEKKSPLCEQRKNPITLRQLLSHTSGSGYPFTPELIKYLTLKGWTPDSPNAATIVERYDFPLSFEPGTSWGYGPGIDWAGLLVERLSKLTLEEFMKKHIFQPLGITGISFWPETLGTAKERIPELVVRRADGTFGPNTKKTLNTNSTDCFGGHGAYAQLGDYLKVQRSLLANDGVLLKPASVDELFRPQLSAKPLAALNFFRKHLSTSLVGGINQDIEVSYGLGGMVFLADDVGRRRKGTLSWGGMVNPFWIIDREAGLALTVGFQVLPTGDAGVKEMTSVAERAVYKMAGLA